MKLWPSSPDHSSISLHITMHPQHELFFKELGERVAEARKAHGLTQQQLAEALGIAQQTLAHYEVGRARLPASMLTTLARLLTLSLDELMGEPIHLCSGKREPMSRLQQQIAAIEQLPKTKQQFVSQMLDAVLAQAR
ncbi:XRE family transcriptional regulator [Ralstonia solanacearum]|uniref:helix-turn-helix transcriptional regulator n=1 Tax=Ralstonia solanacearum TaxID=305 RepID=UPI0001816816|nr:helix-turn-helix transcriptional regulator [Ralstonia solanacearum]MDC6175960.1 helix-turn-helix transcriptional regulator [Ralstonia solanacearum]MDC6208780.1 helix-turn-helix transcriptional regulator [Ralstonia solanacearum]MDC6239494.1 helix-turn-helix transcriptional regulator [Ralstonia solanacearum]MDD7799375.1 helix-turn-helix transcriptional regulator [Ralstonia solanacearum]TYZ55082.1 XRE family transcriptional regulator [Ralstonia solanacearum]